MESCDTRKLCERCYGSTCASVALCSGRQCRNFIVCGDVAPGDSNPCLFDLRNPWTCMNCHMFFGEWTSTGTDSKTLGQGKSREGVLQFSDALLECPVCLELKTSVAHPRCDHFVCIDCFKRCYYGDPDESGKPTFPYPEVEAEYYDTRDAAEWKNGMYPLLALFEYADDLWDTLRAYKYETEEYLRVCPLCRM